MSVYVVYRTLGRCNDTVIIVFKVRLNNDPQY